MQYTEKLNETFYSQQLVCHVPQSIIHRALKSLYSIDNLQQFEISKLRTVISLRFIVVTSLCRVAGTPSGAQITSSQVTPLRRVNAKRSKLSHVDGRSNEYSYCRRSSAPQQLLVYPSVRRAMTRAHPLRNTDTLLRYSRVRFQFREMCCWTILYEAVVERSCDSDGLRRYLDVPSLFSPCEIRLRP